MKRVALSLLFVGFVACAFVSLKAQSGFPDGEGKALTETLCTSCHSAQETLAKRENEAGWKLIVADMVGLGMEATPEDQAIVVTYLAKNFGRTEKAPAPSTPDPAPAP